MQISELLADIKIDLGSDINSLGISDESIISKINESVRKVCSYAPYIKIAQYNLQGKKVILPETTCMVSQVLSDNMTKSVDRDSPIYDEKDLFNASRYIYNYSPMSDPYIYMMNINEMRTLQNMVSINDWYFNKEEHTLYFNNPPSQSIVIKSLQTYDSFEDIKDPDVIQAIKEYSLALCKIVEGNIRRKLQSAPGAIQLDGDSLVSEGISEKTRLDEWIPKEFSYIRFGIRA